MTVTDTSPDSSIQRATSRHRLGLRAAAAALALALVVGVCGAIWWWRHPRAFDAAPTSPSVGLGESRAVDRPPLHVAMAHPSLEADGSVVITGVEPHVVSNSAQARLEFHLCTPTPGASIGSAAGDLGRLCTEVTDVEGATVALSPVDAPRTQVIMTIQATRPGELRVQGIDLSYEYGHQSGTQRVGEYVWLEYD